MKYSLPAADTVGILGWGPKLAVTYVCIYLRLHSLTHGSIIGLMDVAARAVADPTRRALLGLVRYQERTASDLASHFTVTRPAVSQHLRVLTDSGLVTVRSEGTRRYYRARPAGLAELSDWMQDFRGTSLRTLKVEVERDEWNKKQSSKPSKKSSKQSKKSKKNRKKKHRSEGKSGD